MYIDSVRANIGMEENYPALAIFDNSKGQVTNEIMELLRQHGVYVVKIPANCTGRLQPMDISMNKAAKDFLRQQFNEWYAEQVARQLGESHSNTDQPQAQPMNFSSARMKSVGAKWLVKMYEYIRSNPSIVVNGFLKAGIPQAIDGLQTLTTNNSHNDSSNLDDDSSNCDNDSTDDDDV